VKEFKEYIASEVVSSEAHFILWMKIELKFKMIIEKRLRTVREETAQESFVFVHHYDYDKATFDRPI